MVVTNSSLLVCHEMQPIGKTVLGDPRSRSTAGNVHGDQDGNGVELGCALEGRVKCHCLLVYQQSLVGPGGFVPGMVKVDRRLGDLAVVWIVAGW